jgi:hypothetical protein
MDKRTCIKCHEEFEYRYGKPGKINECWDCAEEVKVYRAEQSASEEEGFAFTMTMRPHDEVVDLRPSYLKVAREIEKEVKIQILSAKDRRALVRRKKEEPDFYEKEIDTSGV